MDIFSNYSIYSPNPIVLAVKLCHLRNLMASHQLGIEVLRLDDG